MLNLLKNLWRKNGAAHRKDSSGNNRFRPQVEALETRLVPAPVVNSIQPVAVYLDTHAAFSLGYDTQHNLMWFTEGDSGIGDNIIHSLKPYKAFTSAQMAALPNGTGALAGVKLISDGLNGAGGGAGQLDVAGSTTPSGGSNFDTLTYDSSIQQLVLNQGNLVSFDPFTAGHLNNAYHSGTPNQSGFADGLDVKGNNVWFSPDQGPIYKNGVLFASDSNPAQMVPNQQYGWSGVQDVTTQNGHSLFAVAVLNENDQSGKSRTIVRFDPNTGALLGFDPNPNPVAARWEGLGFDGRYLYAADLRGVKVNANGVEGNIYVFDVTGQGGTLTASAPFIQRPGNDGLASPWTQSVNKISGQISVLNTTGSDFTGDVTLTFSTNIAFRQGFGPPVQAFSPGSYIQPFAGNSDFGRATINAPTANNPHASITFHNVTILNNKSVSLFVTFSSGFGALDLTKTPGSLFFGHGQFSILVS